MLLDRLKEYVQDTAAYDEQLLVVVARPGSGKSRIMRELGLTVGCRYMQASELITEELLELMPQARPREALRIMDEVLTAITAEIILIDGIKDLFAPMLRLDPVNLLRQLSRSRTLICAWPGHVNADKLVFEQDGSLPYREYELRGLRWVSLADLAK